jgi:hypothetical protein
VSLAEGEIEIFRKLEGGTGQNGWSGGVRRVMDSCYPILGGNNNPDCGYCLTPAYRQIEVYRPQSLTSGTAASPAGLKLPPSSNLPSSFNVPKNLGKKGFSLASLDRFEHELIVW